MSELNGLTLHSFIHNANNSGVTHIGWPSKSRFNEIRRHLSGANRSANLTNECIRSDHLACGISRYRTKFTEDFNLCTCSACLAKARRIGYCSSDDVECLTGSCSNSVIVHKDAIGTLSNWIPDNCSVTIENKKIFVVDKTTKKSVKVKSMKDACRLIVSDFYEPFTAENMISDTTIFSKNIFDTSNSTHSVNGFKFDKSTRSINGLILMKKSTLVEVSFADLFRGGYRFEDGTPCGRQLNGSKLTNDPKADAHIDNVGTDLDLNMIGVIEEE